MAIANDTFQNGDDNQIRNLRQNSDRIDFMEIIVPDKHWLDSSLVTMKSVLIKGDKEITRPTPYSCVRLLRVLDQKTKRLKD